MIRSKLIGIFKLCSAVLVLLVTVSPLSAEVSPTLILWGSDEGVERLERSKAKVDFFKLANNFESQSNKIYCGVASSTIVLNALRVRSGGKLQSLPAASSVLEAQDIAHLPKRFSPFFNRYTQTNVFAEGAKTRRQVLGYGNSKGDGSVSDVGLQLEQLKGLLLANGTQVSKHVVDIKIGDSNKKDLKQYRKMKESIVANLKSKNDYVLINYSRKLLGQKGGGHISPVAAYDKKSDSFLVLDVNNNKADWVWVEAIDLFGAMATKDTLENRGFLLVSEF